MSIKTSDDPQFLSRLYVTGKSQVDADAALLKVWMQRQALLSRKDRVEDKCAIKLYNAHYL